MRKKRGTLYTVQKIFFGHDVGGKITRYIEAIAYYTDLKSALVEKAKHTNSFVFPFKCKFYRDRRIRKNIIRAHYH